ncbi:molecular chaperone HtpG [Pseudobutyrivibrio sp. NOR37]|uniref:Molecular chaperone HtpG n=1 Tax=Pseudobutyrivibrio xylanivorans TaxID=185007 RepID=A0A6M0LJW0_PSEXY|nr:MULTISPECIES: molecular chaperone HtpG [Pseudobutyrivibrio]NEX02805.1 molecular chaperone HtpG [Pseudobutyrivibrio xylanivorans]SFR81244.1 molecular chaperone HtpG [Pseudobutyrivibrio sp. NOR37]
MGNKKGSLSITSENIFPVIKKWLYSDHDIFYRELISNGCDAITKLKKLDMMGEYSLPLDYKAKIQVVVSPEDKTLTFIDNGLGMTADEVDEYINQIAFSGATDFLEKYKDKADSDQIIGHFGLGFYSAFMVADEVHIDTLSYKDGATAVHWECDGGTEFEMSDGEWDQVGTKITLFLNEDCLEFANEYRAREVITKYCSFMPTEIFLSKKDAPEEYETIDVADKRDTDKVIEEIHEEAKFEEKENENGEKEQVEVSPAKDKLKIVKRPVPLNETHPLWTKNPSECTDDDYKAFYRDVFHDYKEPLFWIHLNMDYPFNLKGILYFPKINTEYDSIEGTIKLYNNQVFIADNIKEVIPEFLMLLKGVIDCPDLPLNVSRSALQNDGFVTKISEYITKKVADKLTGMCKTEKESYEKYWDDIAPFIKFGCLKDTKFCDKMNDYILFKDINDKYTTLPELLVEEEEKATDENGEAVDAEVVDDNKDADAANNEPEDKRKTVYYVTDVAQQGQYINMFKEQGMNAVILDHAIDTSFITQLEQRNENYKFCRIDADVTDSMVEETAEDELKSETETLTEVFRKALNNQGLEVKVEKFKNKDLSSMITVSEESRRMQDMMKMYAMGGMDMSMFGSASETLVLNANNDLVQYILNNKDGENVDVFAAQLYDLAKIANAPLSPEAMTEFVARSNKIMMLLAK